MLSPAADQTVLINEKQKKKTFTVKLPRTEDVPLTGDKEILFCF